ncbi:NACHT domain-containing protein [Funiculus sociatus GB2-A5]|uniref:NACHT domain-containing protein n=1 Tax=Funiculus sociatus GB2-A5 TaxID=2933946 RepID=A0ABV0JVG0_9CYAN|nr:NACHT domain-containing protein [Trichocoleus sp. FACHB-6]MBD2063392.1 NACHT domain-containing protein [Trichocoleus sp. FACHB-6]
MLLVKNAIAPSSQTPLRIHTSLSPHMTTLNLLQALLLLICVLLSTIVALLPSVFDKQKSLSGRCVIFGLLAVCGLLVFIGTGLITTEQAKQNADWIHKVYWTLVFGCVFALPTMVYLLVNRQSKNSKRSSDTPEVISQPCRQELLASMLTDVIVRVEDSLHDDQLIPLLMEDRREEVGRPPEVTVNAKPSPSWLEKLPKFIRVTAESEPGKKIIDVFERDDIAGRLLILGAPGSGKTTMLLELAQDLILAAQQQPEKPIPVIFELSNWKDDKQAIADWMVADLKFRNKIPEAITREWLETGKLLPLLDGLDELKTRQGKCIARINKFLQTTSGLSQIVVCCREEEYKAGEEILTLRGAVCLKPLEEKQIQGYLQRLNCGHLWHGIQNDPDGLLALAKMPLFLHLIPVAYPNGLESKAKRFNSPDELEVYQEKCRKDLFDAYIKHRLEMPHDCQGYDPKDSKRWLTWLATSLKKQKQTEFFIEKMQPIFLDTTKQKLIFGLILGLISGLIFGLILGLISGLIDKKIELADDLTITWEKARKGLISGLIGLIFGLIGLIFGLIGLIFGLIFGLIGLIFGLIFGLPGEEIKNRNKPNQGIKDSAKNTIIISCILLPAGMLLYAAPLVVRGEFVEPISTMISGLGWALIFGIISAGLPVIQHFALRLILWKSGAIPWNYARFLSYANERRLIKQVGGRYRFIHDLLREHFAKM